MPTSNHQLSDRLSEFVHYSEIKQLAYNIAALQQEKMFRSLAVLSYLPAEGKTLFCAAFAMAYSQIARKEVLVLDTTTIHNKRSFALKDCFNGAGSLVDVMSLDDIRKGVSPPARSSLPPEAEPERSVHLSNAKESDFSLIKKVADERSKQYGLILLDTAPLQAKNRSNIDPLLVARLSDASVLVVSRKFLDSHNISASLNLLKDPALHLIGVIANEEYTQ